MQYQYVSRGEAIGLALGVIWIYPFITIVACVFFGWWGLVAYPILLTLALVEFSGNQRAKAKEYEQ